MRPAVSHHHAAAGVTLLTLSFEGDLALCRLLCETVDRFVPPDVRHLLAVPRGDMAKFAGLGDRRRQILAQESLLPPWLHKLPLPSRAWRRRLGLPRRNVYLSTRGRPVRGWIAQQMMKLAASAAIETELVLHVDSDAAFVRPFAVERLSRGGLSRLLRVPGAADVPSHRPWHAAASTLLGLPPSRYHGADYIDNLLTWRRDNVRGLLDRIAATGGRDAAAMLAGTQDFSEYILYGVYCDKVLGLEAAGHYADATTLCESVWTLPPAAGGALPRIALRPEQVAVAIQSTIPLADTDRRALVEQVIAASA